MQPIVGKTLSVTMMDAEQSPQATAAADPATAAGEHVHIAESISTTSAPPSTPGPSRTPRNFSLAKLMCTPFALGQLIFNMVMSGLGPAVCFYLIFHHTAPKHWNGAPMLGVAIASPWGGAVLSLAWAPVGIPDAVAKGWFGVVQPSAVPRTLRLFPFLRVRVGVLRHLGLGTLAALLWMPPLLLLAYYGEGHGHGEPMHADDFIIFAPAFLAVLPLFILPLGLLGFALPENYARVEAKMSAPEGSGVFCTLVHRGLHAPLC